MLRTQNWLGIAALILVSTSWVALQARADVGSPVTHSPMKDQGGTGFCWSYSLSGMIEGEALKKNRAVELSEEYIGFYSMFDTLVKNLPEIYKAASPTPVRTLGQWLKYQWLIGFLYSPREGAPNLTEPLKVIQKYGVIPQSRYPFKISADDKRLEKRIRQFVKKHLTLKAEVAAYQQDLPRLYADFAEAFGATPPQPTDTFEVDGQTYDALTYLSDYIGFKPDDYVEVRVKHTQEAAAFEQIQRSLNDNSAVELAFTVMAENKKAAVESGTFQSSTCPNGICRHVAGGHAVLIVNSDTSSPGSPLAIQSLIVKNSWGLHGLDENGNAAKLGYFKITPDYLEMPWMRPAAPSPTAADPHPSQPEALERATSRTVWSFLLNKKYL